MTHHASASRTSLLLQCSHWVHADLGSPHAPDAAARRGLALHALADDWLRRRRATDALVNMTARWDLPAGSLDASWRALERWLRTSADGFTSEVAFVLDLASGKARRLFRGEQRAYGDLDDLEIGGTVDMLRVAPAHGRALVLDLKTGDPNHTEPAAQNLQLRTLALAVARRYGLDEVEVGLVFVGEKDEDLVEDRHVLDVIALDAHASRLRAALLDARSASPVLGSHCEAHHCPHRFACPARAALVAKEDQTIAAALLRGVRDADDVRRVFRRLTILESTCERLREEVRAVVDHEGEVELEDGGALRMLVTKGRAIVDGKAALALAKEHGASPADLAVCTRVGAPSKRLHESKRAA